MKDANSKDLPLYRDPMGERMEAARKRREALATQFPPVGNVYDAFYLRIKEVSKEGGGYLLGAEGIIGSPLQFDGKQMALLASTGVCIAKIPSKQAKRLAEHVQNGWTITAFVSMTFYRSSDKRVGADIAFLCWAPQDLAPSEQATDSTTSHAPSTNLLSAEQAEALSVFSSNIAQRLASGDRAELSLTQEQFVNVLKSKGTWYLTRTTKHETLEKGTVVFKSKRSGTERLTAYALQHKVGCNVLASIFWLLLIAGVILLVWNIFFS